MTAQQIREFRFRGEHIPEHMISSVLRYFNDHIEPGKFLCALFGNDFMGAFRSVGDKDFADLQVWAAFLHSEADHRACGHPEKVRGWLAMRQELTEEEEAEDREEEERNWGEDNAITLGLEPR